MNLESLNNWNPWWNSGRVPNILLGVPRKIDILLFKSLKEREVTVLTGVRRSGKTTIMYQMVELLLKQIKPDQILYINLDDEFLKKQTLEEIYNFYRQTKNPSEHAFLFLDEIQNIAQWESFIKKHYDLKENVKFIISGSSASLLKGEYSVLLTGRNLAFNIWPLSFLEFLNFGKINNNGTTAAKNRLISELSNYLEYGGFPEVYFKDKEIKGLLLKQYFDDIIYKDIVSRHNVNAQKITDLAVYLLTNTSNPFTIRKIRNFTGLSLDSIKDYISYLDDSYIIATLDSFSYSTKEKHRAVKKGYAIDTGIRNIAGYIFSRDTGRLAENIILCELKRQNKQIYYWKSMRQSEVDFIVKDRELTAINVSYTDNINKRETDALLEFCEKYKTKQLILITRDTEKQERGIKYIPLWKWLTEME